MDSSFVRHSVSQLAAQAVVFAVVERARALGVPQAVAVLDAGGMLMAFCRMHGAPLVSVEVAQDKAFAALFGLSARECDEQRRGGGASIVLAGRSIGAIGVSGGTPEQDTACTQAGLEALHMRERANPGHGEESDAIGLHRVAEAG